jgi:hypothetical protein
MAPQACDVGRRDRASARAATRARPPAAAQVGAQGRQNGARPGRQLAARKDGQAEIGTPGDLDDGQDFLVAGQRLHLRLVEPPFGEDRVAGEPRRARDERQRDAIDLGHQILAKRRAHGVGDRPLPRGAARSSEPAATASRSRAPRHLDDRQADVSGRSSRRLPSWMTLVVGRLRRAGGRARARARRRGRPRTGRVIRSRSSGTAGIAAPRAAAPHPSWRTPATRSRSAGAG